MPVVVGIDLAAGRGVTEVAALAFDDTNDGIGRAEGVDGGRAPRFLREAYRATQNDDEIVAAVCACAPSVIAIDAPLSLPAAVLAALTGAAALAGVADTTNGLRDATSPQHPSPYTRAAERDPIWRQLGVRPFPVSFLGGLTFRALTLLPRLRAAAPDAAIIEVFPTATLATLGIRYVAPTATPTSVGVADANAKAGPSAIPLAPRSPLSRRSGGGAGGGAGGGGRAPAKTTPARRAATQAGLARWIDCLPDPNAELLGADLLDALAAALTAVAYARGRSLAVGDPTEGQIILPNW